MADKVGVNGRRVQELRNQLGLTQAELAGRAGNLARSYVSNIENRSAMRVSVKTAQALAEGLGVPVTELQVRLPPRASKHDTTYHAPARSDLKELALILIDRLERNLTAAAQNARDLREVLRQVL